MPVALITGASTGIGRQFTHLCARDGYDVVITARSDSALEALAAEIRQQTNREAYVFPKDLAKPGAARELYDEIAARQITVDTLINNAGFGLMGLFWELSEAEQMEMVYLNVGALTDLSRLFLPGFIARKRGAILNVASTAAFQPGPLMSVYYASKAYVVSLSEALHNEAREHSVTVTCLCPGPTRTEFDKRAKLNGKLFAAGHAMDATSVARLGLDALRAGKPLVIAGWKNALMAFLTRFAPIQFTASMARRFQEAR